MVRRWPNFQEGVNVYKIEGRHLEKKNLIISNKLGLHARATMKLVYTACRYSAKINKTYNGRRIDAKDILQTLSLAAAMGSQIDFEIDGPDEQEAMIAITKLIQDKFGED